MTRLKLHTNQLARLRLSLNNGGDNNVVTITISTTAENSASSIVVVQGKALRRQVANLS